MPALASLLLKSNCSIYNTVSFDLSVKDHKIFYPLPMAEGKLTLDTVICLNSSCKSSALCIQVFCLSYAYKSLHLLELSLYLIHYLAAERWQRHYKLISSMICVFAVLSWRNGTAQDPLLCHHCSSGLHVKCHQHATRVGTPAMESLFS
jgi:hypothetical protein